MTKLHYGRSEVQAFVEELILDQMATEEEQLWYEEIQWNNRFNKNNTYKGILRKMKKIYEGNF